MMNQVRRRPTKSMVVSPRSTRRKNDARHLAAPSMLNHPCDPDPGGGEDRGSSPGVETGDDQVEHGPDAQRDGEALDRTDRRAPRAGRRRGGSPCWR